MTKPCDKTSIELFFTMVYESGNWIRVGPAYRRRETAKSWLSLAKNARFARRAKVSRMILPIASPGKTTPQAAMIMSERFNMDVDC